MGDMLQRTILSLLACGFACAAESFENLPGGPIESGQTEYGALSAPAGHASINTHHVRTGKRSLHIQGGENNKVEILFDTPLAEETPCSFWMERWTRRPPFQFRLIAVAANGSEKQISEESKIGPGGFKRRMEARIPAGTKALRMVCTSAENGGVLIDDLELHNGPMVVKKLELSNPGVYPMFRRAPINPVIKVDVATAGVKNAKSINSLSLNISPADQVKNVSLCTGTPDGTNMHNIKVFGSAQPDANGNVTIKFDGAVLPAGESTLWIDATPTDTARVGGSVSFNNVELTVDGKGYKAPATVTQRVGHLMALPGEKVGNQPNGNPGRDCVAFRIPGMIRTASGALVGCFDARYHHEGDLCADIDVAAVRSTDGGQTWSLPTVCMDSGPGGANGCGDPCIVQDKTGRIWIQALACHFSGGASLWTSKTGNNYYTTGQWEMVYSDDDGKTWSYQHVNPTKQIKKDEWNCILAGPGCGITTSKGVIVFPAQIWQTGAKYNCMSTICYSTDGGLSWKYGKGIPHRTSECQVVELQDGSIMLNCRNENRSGKRVVYVTKDLGETWAPHDTNLTALPEPTCQGSLVNATVDGKPMLLFSNPATSGGRFDMGIRYSEDDGKTWSKPLTYDSRRCMGYSCVAMVDDKNVGIIYETSHTNGKNGNRGIGFIILPLSEILATGK